MGNVDYNFRAGLFTRKSTLKEHASKLANAHTSLFNEIDFSKLVLDKGAINILTSACGLIKIILDRKEKSYKPLYVAMGENHSVSAHILSHMLVIKGLLAEDIKVSLGLEERKSYMEAFFIDDVRYAANSDLRESRIRDYFNSNNLVLNYNFFCRSNCAPYSLKLLSNFLLQQSASDNLSVKLTDAPLVVGEYGQETDYLDIRNKFIAARAGERIEVSALDGDGVDIRNGYMVNELSESDPDIVTLQITGNIHIDKKLSSIFENSKTLLDFADEAGFDAIGHISYHKDIKKYAPEYPDRKTVYQDNVYISPSSSKKIFKWDKAPSLEDLIKHGEEIEWADDKMQLLGMGDVIAGGILDINSKHTEDLNNHIDEAAKLAQDAYHIG